MSPGSLPRHTYSAGTRLHRIHRAGITAATVHGPDYADANALAARAVAEGLGGVRWHARHDLAAEAVAVAWFGAPDPGLPRPHSTPIPSDLVARACGEFDYVVLPTP